ncbi:uncharacterized protein [Asterias amurensis]|uniref:uncharacterized protein isoform X1 n=1 Tax=Asterias amurensis TaxID=7602 RepID=UPI003AB574D3
MSEQGTEDREEQQPASGEQDEKPATEENNEDEQKQQEEAVDGENTDKKNESNEGRERGTKRGRPKGTKVGTVNSTAEESKRQKQFVAEFNRLKDSLEKEATKIIKPEFQPHTPYIHTSLAPYYNTYTVQYLLDLPPHVRHGYITRKTAIGLVDPEVSHTMDVSLDSVPDSVEIPVTSMTGDLSPRSQAVKNREGSTRLPKWPVVKFQKREDPNKKLNWSDVPKLRESLKTQYSSNAQDRIKRDYQRTQQDWTRMELEKLREIHEVNRSHMRITCGTYLGTSKGSRQAVKSLTKVLE